LDEKERLAILINGKAMSLRVAHIGLGPIGCAVVTQIAARESIQSVCAIDLDPQKIGKGLGEIVGSDASNLKNVAVCPDMEAALRETKPDVAVLCTGSSLTSVWPQIETILRAGVPLVSTTEELAFPSGPNAHLAQKLDELAKECSVGLVGTGVNPGFVMDTLPVLLSGACERVEKIRVERVQDAGARRLPFQLKIGAGLSPEEWQQKADAGTVRHVGLRESISMIAAALGWELERITDEIAPVIAQQAVSSPHLSIAAGQVCGMKQDGAGYKGGVAVIELHMEAYLGAPQSYEMTRIEGNPPLEMRIDGGLAGDVATAAVVINTLPKIVRAPAGFHTMLSLPLPSFYSGKA
jgi:hypothetical protein